MNPTILPIRPEPATLPMVDRSWERITSEIRSILEDSELSHHARLVAVGMVVLKGMKEKI